MAERPESRGTIVKHIINPKSFLKMSEKIIQWEAVQKKVFGEEKWVAKIHYGGQCSFKDIVNEVANRASAQPSEVEGVISAYLHQIRTYVMTGRSVNIDGVGTFYPNLSTKLVATPEEATVQNCVKTITVGFRPATTLRKTVRAGKLGEYKRADNIHQTTEE